METEKLTIPMDAELKRQLAERAKAESSRLRRVTMSEIARRAILGYLDSGARIPSTLMDS